MAGDPEKKFPDDAMEEIRSYIGSLNQQEIDTLLANLNDRLKDLRDSAARNGLSVPKSGDASGEAI